MIKLVNFAFVISCVAYSYAVPIDHESLTRSDSETTNPNNVNESNLFSIEKVRNAYYPLSGGYGYNTVGQNFYPVPYFPNGWAYPQPSKLIAPQPAGQSIGRSAEGTSSFADNSQKTHRPMTYYTQAPQSEYQQHYAVASQPLSYQGSYILPATSFSSHDQWSPRLRAIFGPNGFISGNQDMVSAQPPVKYRIQYLYDRPDTPHYEELTGSPSTIYSNSPVPTSSMPNQPENGGQVSYHATTGRDADGVYKILPNSHSVSYSGIDDLRKQGLYLDGTELKIMPDYLSTRLYPYMQSPVVPVSPIPHSIVHQPVTYSNIVSQPTPIISSQPVIHPFKSTNERFGKTGYDTPYAYEQDPYKSPEDRIYLEPMPLSPDSQITTLVQKPPSFKSASSDVSYYDSGMWNANDQLDMAKIQYYNNIAPERVNYLDSNMLRNYNEQYGDDRRNYNPKMQLTQAQIETRKDVLQPVENMENLKESRKENAQNRVTVTGTEEKSSRNSEEKQSDVTNFVKGAIGKLMNEKKQSSTNSPNDVKIPDEKSNGERGMKEGDEKKNDDKIVTRKS